MSRQVKNKFGSIPLHFAAIKGHLRVFKLLLEDDGRADISIPNFLGRTPLFFAVSNNRIEVVQHIIDNYPATINVMFSPGKTGTNYTALDIASDPCIRQRLLDNSAKGSIEIELEKDDFSLAVDKDITFFEKMSNEELLQLCKEFYNFPILYVLAIFKNLNHRIEDLKILKVNGTDTDSWVSFFERDTALHLCAWNGQLNCTRLLLQVS